MLAPEFKISLADLKLVMKQLKLVMKSVKDKRGREGFLIKEPKFGGLYEKIFVAYSFLLWLCLITGCATTNLSSFRDPTVVGKQFHKILVMVPFSDLESREAAEKAFTNQFSTLGVEAIPSISIFMPTRTYNSEEMVHSITENKIEAVLLVKLTDAYTTETYIPQSSSTYGTGTVSGNYLNYSARTRYYGGYYLSKPRVRYEIQLVDVSSGKVGWIGTSITRGNAFADFATLIESLASTTVQRLKEEELLR